MRKETVDEELINQIDNILALEYRPVSVKEITKILKRDYGINRSPQFVLRHLIILKKRKKIKEK